MITGDSERILVTGAAGFIGSSLCRELARKGAVVLGVDNINDYYSPVLKYARLENLGFSGVQDGRLTESTLYANLSFVRADITELGRMKALFDVFKPDRVVNLAAQAGVRYSIENPFSYTSSNVEGFLVMLECVRHYPVKRFVYASSSSVYGRNNKVPFSETDAVDSPVSLYAATKKSNELMARAYRSLYGVPAVGLRFFTVYGPWGRPDMAPMIFADAISSGKALKVFNNGEMSRDFTYIDDIVKGMVKVVAGDGEIDDSNDILNIGHGSPVALMDFISLLEEAFGKKAPKEFLPMQKGDVYSTFADTSRLQSLYGYCPETSLEEGIGRFAEWYDSKDNPLR